MSTRYIARAIVSEKKRRNRTNKFTSGKKSHKWSWKLLLSDNDIYGLNIKSFEMLRIIIYYFSLLKSFVAAAVSLWKLWEKGTLCCAQKKVWRNMNKKMKNKKLRLTSSIFNSKVWGREKKVFLYSWALWGAA